MAALTTLLAFATACDRSAPPQKLASQRMACELDHAADCTTQTRWGPVSIELSPRPVQPLRPAHVVVRFTRPNAAKATLDLTGMDMDMGPNRAPMKRLDERTLTGDFTPPVCLTGTMRWRLDIRLSDDQSSETLPLAFTTRH